jgi:hypothetical protein
MPFLKDVMPLPRLEPNSGSFLPPKIRKAMAMIISNSGVPKPNIFFTSNPKVSFVFDYFLPILHETTLLMEETASSPDENPFPEQELHWRQPKVARPGKGRSRNIKN